MALAKITPQLQGTILELVPVVLHDALESRFAWLLPDAMWAFR